MPPGRFFCTHLTEGMIELSREESHHARDVLRAEVGDEIELFDGRGGRADGRITAVRRHAVEVRAGPISQAPFDLPHRLTLAVPMAKGPRQSYLIEKCTELGAAAVRPLLTERTVAKPTAAGIAKWRRRALEACKQSRRLWLPIIEEPCTLDQCTADIGRFDAAALADREGAASDLAAFVEQNATAATLLVLIGPEGGWTPAERNAVVEAGAVPVRLAPTVLRVETAAVAVCAAVAMRSAGAHHPPYNPPMP